MQGFVKHFVSNFFHDLDDVLVDWSLFGMGKIRQQRFVTWLPPNVFALNGCFSWKFFGNCNAMVGLAAPEYKTLSPCLSFSKPCRLGHGQCSLSHSTMFILRSEFKNQLEGVA